MLQSPAEAPAIRVRRRPLASSLWIGAKALEVLALALWLGGFVTAGAVVAPLAFELLARPEAGALMGACFRRLNGIGIVCGGMLLAALALEAAARPDPARRLLALRAGLVGGALALALYLGFIHFPAMEAARAAAGGASAVAGASGPNFDRMHALSRQLLSLQMLLLLGVIVGSATAAAKGR
jgi:hypothetical protein